MKVLYIVIVCLFTVMSAPCAAHANIPHDEEITAIRKLIETFIDNFNDRKPEAMLTMYAESATIWADIDGEIKVFSKEEYRPVLAHRMEVLPWKWVTIMDYVIDELLFENDTVSFTIDFIGKMTMFTGHALYGVVAKKIDGQWRVIEEKTLSPLGMAPASASAGQMN